MTYRKYSQAELRWYKAGYLTISRRIEKEIQKTYNEDGQIRHIYAEEKKSFLKLKWRLGYNQYKSGYFKEAISTLTIVTDALQSQPTAASRSMKKKSDQDITDPAHVHQVIGQAGMYIFLSTGEHSHLETSYKHYQFAVDYIQANLVAMFKLPALLLDYARVLEYYGSFETSMSVYSQILTRFPNFTGYFTALYRTAVVGRHLASLCSESQEKQDTVDKCIDILQFLLEALPANVNEVR
ncbi:hypothetical protein EON65_29190 [archaeon]|nr:MAG: hypothetical protein EON65_29190 [archaeon]